MHCPRKDLGGEKDVSHCRRKAAATYPCQSDVRVVNSFQIRIASASDKLCEQRDWYYVYSYTRKSWQRLRASPTFCAWDFKKTTILLPTIVMLPTIRLLQHSVRITLFARENCSLCEEGKRVIQELRKKRSFDYDQVDVMASGQQQWKILYEFDTPVVGIHPHYRRGAAHPKAKASRPTSFPSKLKTSQTDALL